MDKKCFNEVFIEAEKKTVRRYLETLIEQLDEEDYSGIETYAGYLQKSASRLLAYQMVDEIAYPGEK